MLGDYVDWCTGLGCVMGIHEPGFRLVPTRDGYLDQELSHMIIKSRGFFFFSLRHQCHVIEAPSIV